MCGVLDFEMSSTAPLVYDVAVAICDWGFLQDKFVSPRVRALVDGYETIRPMRKEESAALYEMCRFAAARFAVTRFYDFEVHRRPEAQRTYKDYRHFLARLRSLMALGQDGFDRAVFDGAM